MDGFCPAMPKSAASFMLGVRSAWKGQQTMLPCRIGSPYRSAAMRGATAAFTVSNRFIGNFSFQIFATNFLCHLNIRRKGLRPTKSGTYASK